MRSKIKIIFSEIKSIFFQISAFFTKTPLTEKQIKKLIYHDRIWLKFGGSPPGIGQLLNILFKLLCDKGYTFNYHMDIRKCLWVK